MGQSSPGHHRAILLLPGGRLDKGRRIQVAIAAMDRGEAGAAARTHCPVTSDIHAALCIIPAAGREAVELALVNRCGSCCDLRRARAVRNHHRACDQQQPEGFIHGTGSLSWSRPFSLWTILDQRSCSANQSTERLPDHEMLHSRTWVPDTGSSGVHDVWGWSIESLSTKLIRRRKGRWIV